MNWDDLRYLLTLADTGSLSAAGDRLRVSPSTVSRRIETLEAALGTRLFTPHREGFALTEAGRNLLPEAEKAAAALGGFERKARGMTAGLTLRMAAPELLAQALLPAVSAVLDKFPDLQIEVQGSVQPVRLKAEEADIVLRLVRPELGDYTLRRLGHISFGLYGQAEALIGWPDDQGHLLMARWLADLCPGIVPRLRLGSLAAHLDAVAQGLGRGVLPDFAARQAHLGAKAEGPAIGADLWMLIRRRCVGPEIEGLSQAIAQAVTRLNTLC